MRPAAQLQATIELLDEIQQTRYPADRVMSQYFRRRRYIGSKDKGVISERFYRILRHRLSYEYLLNSVDLSANSRMLVALTLKLENIEIENLFDGVRHNPEPLKPLQLSAFQKLDVDSLDNAPPHIQFNIPEWIEPKLKLALGEQYPAEAAAMDQRACTDIRVNTLKTNVSEVLHVLKEIGFSVAPTQLSPWCVRFNQRVALFGLDAFKQGLFEVQDEGSQLLAMLTQVKPGYKVVDFCAGAGGKTLAMSAMMENKGVIYACDVHSKRLEQLQKRSRRAGVHNVRSHVLSSENDKWVKQHRGIADVVLIDAPCSGTGTWRRNPDSRWNLTQKNLDDLILLQRSILDSAKRLIKPGGRLFYATCSLLQEENEQQIEWFLAANHDYSIQKIALTEEMLMRISDRVSINGYQLRTLPGLSGTDGFYMASLIRAEAI